MRRQYWFYIDTYVHISIKKDAVLFYNSYTGKILEYSGKPDILGLTGRLLSSKNLRVIRLSERELNNPIIHAFVNEIRDHFMGDLIDVSLSEGKPIQMPPIVKVQRDVKYLRGEPGRSVGEDMMEYLSDVSLYINNRCGQNCTICSRAYCQFLCCTAAKTRGHELNIKYVKRFINEIKDCSLLNLNILGGDIFMYSKLDELLELINSIQAQKNYFIHYLNVAAHRYLLNILISSKTMIKIPISFPVDERKLKTAIETAASLGVEAAFYFVIRSEKDFEDAEVLISQLHIKNQEFHALYDGTNFDFFRENIFIDREEIEDVRPSLKDIYARGTVNPLNFGHLTILANGGIYANVNKSRLGFLGKHSIYDIVFKEMKNGESWRLIRKNVLPCKSCTFEKLCPPISNYNVAIGKNNLCHIWQGK